MNDSTSHGQVLRIGDKPIELRLVALNSLMLRITAVPLRAGDSPEPVPSAPEIIVHETGSVIATIRGLAGDRSFEWGGNRVRVSADPLRIVIADAAGRTCQDLRIAPHGRIDFSLGDGPLFGLGQGGRQFDRRGGLFERINGQGEGVRSIDMNTPGSRAPEYAFDLAGEGARITIPWLISADGWASYFHLPQGTFDLTGTRGQLIPEQADAFVDAFWSCRAIRPRSCGNTPCSPASRICRRSGRSATCNPTAPWRAATRCWRKSPNSANAGFPATA